MLDRAAIAARLHEIALHLELQGTNKFKVRAFERGARALEAWRGSPEQLDDEDALLAIPGIGAALAHQITELRRTGRSELLESLRAGLPRGVLELAQISGVGLHALKRLHDELGIASIDDLRDAARAGKLRDVKGFGEKKEAKILAAIERYAATGPTITLAEGLRRADDLTAEIGLIDGVQSVHLAGSLRRGAELAHAIELVVSTDRPSTLLPAIASLPRVARQERAGETWSRLRLIDGTVVEVIASAPRELPIALARHTSSAEHFEALQSRARERGFDLEAGGLSRDGVPVPLRDERALYESIGLTWIPPELREDRDTIGAAAAGDPFDLVELEDLRGFVHCHTTWSDGHDTIEDMARAAEARGASFITITDHSATAHYAGGLDVDRLKRQWDAIAEAQEHVKIKILRGTEADILADGAIDWPDAVLEQLDVVIASIHSRYRQDEAKMTERVLRAMRHPVFKIWGHPMGRLVTSRPPIPLRLDEVLEALAASRGAIEINGDPHRLDLEPGGVRAARRLGIPVVVSVDAHSTKDLAFARYGVTLARRAGVRKNEVLNARGAAAFARAVRPA